MDHNLTTFNAYLQTLDPKSTIDNLLPVDRNQTWLFINDKTKNLNQLSKFEQLETLHYNENNPDLINNFCLLKNLKYLQLGYFRFSNLAGLNSFPNIEILVFTDFKGLLSLKGIDLFSNLKMLFIENCKKLRILDGIENLKKLKSFSISGGSLKVTRINSLQPLSIIKTLETIHIDTIKVLDERLDWLNDLSSLRELHLPNYFPTEEYAKLSTKLKNTICNLFQPYVLLNDNRVMITGKQKPFLHLEIDSDKIAKYVTEFENMKIFST